MLAYKCDRCGNETYDRQEFAFLEITTPCDIGDCIENFALCEQCYTTIKEVLEDGDIT